MIVHRSSLSSSFFLPPPRSGRMLTWRWRHETSALAHVAPFSLVFTLCYGMVVPVLPQLITEHFAGGNVSQASQTYGKILAVSGFCELLCSPVLGVLSDRFGRRPVLLAASLAACVDYALVGLAPTSTTWLYVGKIFAGSTLAALSMLHAYIADRTPPDQRARGYGLLGATFATGFTIGPTVGGFLGRSVGLRVPVAIASIAMLFNFLYVLFLLPESLPQTNRTGPIPWSRVNPVGALRILTSSETLTRLALMLFCAEMGKQIVNSTWVHYAHIVFGWHTFQNGLFLTTIGLLGVLSQGAGVRVLERILSHEMSILIGLLSYVVCYSTLPLCTSTWGVYGVVVFTSLCYVVTPMTQAVLSRQVGPHVQGTLQGALTSLKTVTRLIGPLLGTWIFSSLTTHLEFSAGILLAAASFYCIGGALIFHELYKKGSGNKVA